KFDRQPRRTDARVTELTKLRLVHHSRKRLYSLASDAVGFEWSCTVAIWRPLEWSMISQTARLCDGSTIESGPHRRGRRSIGQPRDVGSRIRCRKLLPCDQLRDQSRP